MSAARRLLEHGARVDAQGAQSGRAALMWAALKGHAGFTRMLLASGAGPAMRESAGDTALELAGQARQKKVVELLTALQPGTDRVNRPAPAAQ